MRAKLLTIIGARPQIIKAAAISRAIKLSFADRIEEKILHTGQHYDANMSQVFFDELDIPHADYNLGVGSASHGEQTAKMIVGIEKILLQEHFDGVILYGDTNSTLAGAVAAAKIKVPVFHIEAGLRSFNMQMPEEQNRIACDHLSQMLFAPTQTALNNLQNEGLTNSPATFANKRKRAAYNSGDVMYDNSLYFSQFSHKKCNILQAQNIVDQPFILATIHRNNNTDSAERLTAIFNALLDIAESHCIKIVLPLHPRTKKMLDSSLNPQTSARLKTNKLLRMIPPASFFEIIELEKHAKLVMTDSGGVQKEAFFFSKPCVILRPETEWVEIVEHHAGIVADADYKRIVDAYNKLINRHVQFPPLFGDGKAAHLILDKIIEYLN